MSVMVVCACVVNVSQWVVVVVAVVAVHVREVGVID